MNYTRDCLAFFQPRWGPNNSKNLQEQITHRNSLYVYRENYNAEKFTGIGAFINPQRDVHVLWYLVVTILMDMLRASPHGGLWQVPRWQVP